MWEMTSAALYDLNESDIGDTEEKRVHKGGVFEYDCRCNEWQNGWGKQESIIEAVLLCGRKYEGPTILYCPWCGEMPDSHRPEKAHFRDMSLNRVEI